MGIHDKMERLFLNLPLILTIIAFAVFLLSLYSGFGPMLSEDRAGFGRFSWTNVAVILSSAFTSLSALLTFAALVHAANRYGRGNAT